MHGPPPPSKRVHALIAAVEPQVGDRAAALAILARNNARLDAAFDLWRAEAKHMPDTIEAPEPGEVEYIAGRLPLVPSAGAAERAAELLRWQAKEIAWLHDQLDRRLGVAVDG